MKTLITLSLMTYLLGFSVGVVTYNYVNYDAGNKCKINYTSDSKITTTSGRFELTTRILSNNTLFISTMAAGVFLFGVPTFISLFIDSFRTSIMVTEALSNLPFAQVFLLTGPHFVFEAPAIILAGAAGFKSLEVLVRHLRGGSFIERRDVKDFFKLVFASSILIIIAGVIEANITPIFLPK